MALGWSPGGAKSDTSRNALVGGTDTHPAIRAPVRGAAGAGTGNVTAE